MWYFSEYNLSNIKFPYTQLNVVENGKIQFSKNEFGFYYIISV